MHDLQTIRYINAYAATVEKLKSGSEPFPPKVWPSDAPAIPRAKLEGVALAGKALARRRALLFSALKKQALR